MRYLAHKKVPYQRIGRAASFMKFGKWLHEALCRSVKSLIFSLKNLYLVGIFKIVLIGVVRELKVESDCNMPRLVYYRHFLQLQVCN